MKKAIAENKDYKYVSIIDVPQKHDSFSMLENIFITTNSKDGTRLSELCEYIGTGKTPSRGSYTEQGHFLIKVGNLSGAGINWEARDRNHISDEEICKRSQSKKPLILKHGDILLTSSAH